MRTAFTWVACTVAAWLCCPTLVDAQLQRSSLSGYVTATTDYRRHGLSYSQGEASVQVGGDYQHRSGFFGGAWIATIEYASGRADSSSSQRELGFYVGYSRPLDDWSFTATAAGYEYPEAVRDYDYIEVSGSAAFRDTLFFSASYSDDLFALGASALNQEIGVSFPIAGALELGATLGRFRSDELDVRLTHWNVGLSRTLAARVGLDLRYYDGSRYFASPMGTTAGDAWVLSASYGFGAR